MIRLCQAQTSQGTGECCIPPFWQNNLPHPNTIRNSQLQTSKETKKKLPCKRQSKLDYTCEQNYWLKSTPLLCLERFSQFPALHSSSICCTCCLLSSLPEVTALQEKQKRIQILALQWKARHHTFQVPNRWVCKYEPVGSKDALMQVTYGGGCWQQPPGSWKHCKSQMGPGAISWKACHNHQAKFNHLVQVLLGISSVSHTST